MHTGEVPNFGLYQVDAHVVAGLLKSFLREMAEPCIPFALYDKFLEVGRSGTSRLFSSRSGSVLLFVCCLARVCLDGSVTDLGEVCFDPLGGVPETQTRARRRA